MATTLQNLIDDCEADLADSGNATWAAADIEQWCRDAIADISQHFPRTLIQDITTSLNDRQYDLPAGILDILNVEYPQGEDPPEHLLPRSIHHPQFWNVDGYYFHLRHGDDTDVDEFLMSTKPPASETIRITNTAIHDNTIITSANITVLPRHQHIMRNYVLWRAALQLTVIEEASPTSNSSLLMSQLAVNVDRARRAYVDALAKAVFAETQSGPVSWQNATEETTRIY